MSNPGRKLSFRDRLRPAGWSLVAIGALLAGGTVGFAAGWADESFHRGLPLLSLIVVFVIGGLAMAVGSMLAGPPGLFAGRRR